MPDFVFEHIEKIVIGVIAVAVWIIGKIKENRDKQAETWEPQEEDYLPEDYRPSQPPPLYPSTGSPPPPLPTYTAADDSELERQRKMQDRLRAIRDKKGATPKVSASKAAAKAKKSQPAPSLVSPSKLRERLRDRKELRRAIVMNEILNPPVSLR